MLPPYVPRVIAADFTSQGVVIIFDDNRAALFPSALLYKTMLLSELPQLPEPAEASGPGDERRP
jgi:hypothetical protein